METFDQNPIYQQYSTSLANEVPLTQLRTLIAIFMADAEVNLGSAADEKTLERCIWHAGHQYGHLPVCYIASGYARGSIGDFGVGRLTPATIKKWMDAVTEDYNRKLAKEKMDTLMRSDGEKMDLHKFPAGKAILKKMDWLTSKAITEEEWDKISLKRLAADLQAGHDYESDYYIPF
jgi:hypothetical protein